ncbi:MAG: TM2 domain-containing protein [Pirellulales bacterium]|nr:TM2 domain-containing protein [Pirellulales bacterium]
MSTAALLAGICGLGLHRFYLGYWLIGTLQLVTLGGCLIWAAVDLIRILNGTLKAADGSELIRD